MAKITARIINAFVDAGKGGNPAGVILDADVLDTATKQRIAAHIGVSEAAFISQSRIADFKLEFFTPTRQIAHCGHATIATFVFLAQQGRLKSSHTSKETIDGRRDIFIVDDMAFMEQTAPKYTSLHASQHGVGLLEVLDSLSLKASDLPTNIEPMVVNTGNNFLIVPVREQITLRNLKPDFPAIEKISAALNLIGYYAFSTQTFVPGRQSSARMFAPWYGIQEEAATGMAAGPLACYLYEYLGMEQTRLIIEQGFMMQPTSPSEIIVDLNVRENEIESLLVGGRAQVTRVMEIEI